MELMKKIQRIEYENKEMMEFLSNTSEKKTSITSLSTLSMGSNSYDSNCIKFMQNRNIFSNNTH